MRYETDPMHDEHINCNQLCKLIRRRRVPSLTHRVMPCCSQRISGASPFSNSIDEKKNKREREEIEYKEKQGGRMSAVWGWVRTWRTPQLRLFCHSKPSTRVLDALQSGSTTTSQIEVATGCLFFFPNSSPFGLAGLQSLLSTEVIA